jgi:hypothetical protein
MRLHPLNLDVQPISLVKLHPKLSALNVTLARAACKILSFKGNNENVSVQQTQAWFGQGLQHFPAENQHGDQNLNHVIKKGHNFGLLFKNFSIILS